MGTQRGKVAKQRRRNVALLILLVILAACGALYSARNFALCAHIQKGEYSQYTGEFTLSTQSRGKNTLYIITLGNGDVIRADPDLIEQNASFKSASVLQFTYSLPRYLLGSAYHCVEIRDPSDGTAYLQSTAVYEEAKACAWIGAVVAGVFLLFSIPLCVDVLHRRN